MSAETLRKAAALMRERAEAATPGPWEGSFDDSGMPHWTVLTARMGDQVATHEVDPPHFYEEAHGKDGADAYHIASWHPAVAVAFAKELDRAADDHPDCATGDLCEVMDLLVPFARAYLGEQS